MILEYYILEYPTEKQTFSCGAHDVDRTNHRGQRRSIWSGLDNFNSVKVVDHSQRDIYQSRRSRSCIVDNWKLHDSIHHLKSSFVKKNLFHQFTFSLVPEVRAFGSGSTEAAISEKGNDGKFDAVSSLSMCNNASVLTRTTLNQPLKPIPSISEQHLCFKDISRTIYV